MQTKDLDYQVIDNIKCYAPDLAFENSDFPSKSFEFLYNIEAKNFWFSSRNRIIEYLFKKYAGITNTMKVLEIGCGTGFVLQMLSGFKNLELVGAELYLEGLKYAKKRLPCVEFIQLDARKMPYENEFDVICAFDTLEHIEEDELVMRNVYQALKPGGYFFISVPQHKWLWSWMDAGSCHKRRYSKKELTQKLRKTNFSMVYINSFVFTLLPLMFLSRLTLKRKPILQDVGKRLILSSVANTILGFLMRLDELLISAGIQLPFGGSLIIVAKKC